MEEQWTILKVIQWTTGYFDRKGIDQPRANAEVLLAHILHLERLQLYLRYDQPLTPAELSAYRDAVRRRAEREPTQYITGHQEFWSLDLEVGPEVLIPRPETELLVEQALALLPETGARVLDVGTGSGAIAIALAHERPALEIVAVDRSLPALATARRNARRHNVVERIHFASMDLLSALHPSHARFMLIVSNPPYIGDREWSDLAPEVSRYEPEPALRGGGPEGLETPRRLLRDTPPHLLPGGALLMEIGHEQGDILLQEAGQDSRWRDAELIRDYSGIRRVLKTTLSNV